MAFEAHNALDIGILRLGSHMQTDRNTKHIVQGILRAYPPHASPTKRGDNKATEGPGPDGGR
jgi:hypothetical protein